MYTRGYVPNTFLSQTVFSHDTNTVSNTYYIGVQFVTNVGVCTYDMYVYAQHTHTHVYICICTYVRMHLCLADMERLFVQINR